MDAAGRMELIRELCSFDGRYPGTDAERRAANFLAERLRGMGRRAEVEPTFVHPEYALVHALHCALAIAGSLASTVAPPLGFGLVLLAATSMYLDLNTRFYLFRRLFFRRASQNVVSPGPRPEAPAPRPEAPARLILIAHYDAAKTGYVFGPRSVRLARRLPERWRLLLGPFRLIFWGGITPLLPLLGMRMAGVEVGWVSVLQLVPTILLIVAVFLLVDIALSKVVPGAYDNASGVATALSVAEALDREPPRSLDVWVVLSGAEECFCEGMREFVRAHRDEFDPQGSCFVNVDSTSYGTVAYQASEGAVVSYAMDRRLIELCEAIAAADREGERRYDARAIRSPLLSDALPARVAGFRAISIAGLEDGVMPPWYHTLDDTPERLDEKAMSRSVEFTLALVRQLDADVSRQTGVVARGPVQAEAR